MHTNMSKIQSEKIIRVLKTLLELDDSEIIKYTLQSLIEELEDATHLSGNGSNP